MRKSELYKIHNTSSMYYRPFNLYIMGVLIYWFFVKLFPVFVRPSMRSVRLDLADHNFIISWRTYLKND